MPTRRSFPPRDSPTTVSRWSFVTWERVSLDQAWFISIISVTWIIMHHVVWSGRVSANPSTIFLLGYFFMIDWIQGICCSEGDGMSQIILTMCSVMHMSMRTGGICFLTVFSVLGSGIICKFHGTRDVHLKLLLLLEECLMAYVFQKLWSLPAGV